MKQPVKAAKNRGEIRIPVRSGRAVPDGEGRVRVAVVTRGARPMLWLGAGPREGIAWIGGLDTLRRIRDALNEALP